MTKDQRRSLTKKALLDALVICLKDQDFNEITTIRLVQTYLLYIWEMDEPRQCCNMVIVSVLLMKSRNAQKLDAKVYVWIVCDTYR